MPAALSPLDITALPSAARTATTASNTITNPGYSCLKLFLNITVASGTGGLYPQIVYIDPVSGTTTTFTVWGTTAHTTTGLVTYNLGPYASLNVLAGGAAIDFLPSQFQISIHHGDTSSYTYSVGLSLVSP